MSLTSRTRNSSSGFVHPSPMYKRTMADWVNDSWKEELQAGILSCNAMESWTYQSSGFVPLRVYYNQWYRSMSTAPWIYQGLKNKVLDFPSLQFANAASWDSTAPWINALAKMSSAGFVLDDPGEGSIAGQIHTKLSDRLSSGIALVGVSYIERLKTIRMFKEAVKLLKHPFINARNALGISRAALRGNPNAALTVMNEANKRWLEGRYGWRPLAYEVMAMFDAAAQGDNQRITVRTWNGAEPFSRTDTYRSWTTGYVAGSINGEFSGSRINRYGQTGDFNFSVSNFARDYGLFDVVGTAWEAVPYSFVVDWYINIGEMLGALQAFVMLDERVGWTTDNTQLAMRFFPIVTNPGNVAATKGTKQIFSHFDPPNWEAWERVKLKTRSPVTSFAPVIDFRCNLDVAKIIDQIALLRQITLRGKKT